VLQWSTMNYNSIFPLFAIVVVGFMVYVLAKGAKQWNDNNHAPLETVDATCVRKFSELHQTQTPVGGDPTGAQGYMTSSTETLYGEFLTGDGQQLRFVLGGEAYRSLSEGQSGALSYQGTRFVDFQVRN